MYYVERKTMNKTEYNLFTGTITSMLHNQLNFIAIRNDFIWFNSLMAQPKIEQAASATALLNKLCKEAKLRYF